LSLVKRGVLSCSSLYAYFYDTPLSVPTYGLVAHSPEHRLTAAPAGDLMKTTKGSRIWKLVVLKRNFIAISLRTIQRKYFEILIAVNITSLYALDCGIECKAVPFIVVFVFFRFFPVSQQMFPLTT
jgi:hypothetical protein